MEALLVYLVMAILISIIAIREDRLKQKISEGFDPNAKDGDKDGIVQENTKFERKVKKGNR